MITKLVSPHASLEGAALITLAVFAVAALPGYLLAAFTIDRIGRRRTQAGGFAVMAVAFLGLWLIPGATTTLLLFGARLRHSREWAERRYILCFFASW